MCVPGQGGRGGDSSVNSVVNRHGICTDGVHVCMYDSRSVSAGGLFPFQVQQYLEEAQMEMEVEFTAEDDPDKMKDVLAKLEVRACVNATLGFVWYNVWLMFQELENSGTCL